MRLGVVIPTLGQNFNWLEQSLGSVRVASREVKIVLVTPSINSTLENLASKYDAILLQETSKGIYPAINQGIRLLSETCDFYMYLGDDDLLFPTSITNLSHHFDSESVAAVYGAIEYIDKDMNVLMKNPTYFFAVLMLRWIPNLIPNPGAIVRISAWEKLQGYNENYRWASDLDFWIRLKDIGAIRRSKPIVTAFRWHEKSMTAGQRDSSLKEASRVRISNSKTRASRFLHTCWEPILTALGEAIRRFRMAQ
jgi:hypothetical protein